MRRTRIALVLVVLALFAVTTTAFADTVRGKVVYADGTTAYANVAVTLGQATVYTGSDGMFYLVRVPPGQYTVEVKSAREKKTITVVVTAAPYTDVPPVALN